MLIICISFDMTTNCTVAFNVFFPLITLETSAKVSRLITQALEFLVYRLHKPL